MLKKRILGFFINLLLSIPKYHFLTRLNALYVFAGAFFFFFLVHAIWSLLNGRFFPASGPYYNFLDDFPDFIAHTVIVPAYFAAGVLYLKTSYRVIVDSKRDGVIKYNPTILATSIPKWVGITFWHIIICGCYGAIIAILYHREFMKNSLIWWCMERVCNINILTLHGYYYISCIFFIQFWLIFIVIEMLRVIMETLLVFTKGDMHPQWHSVDKGFRHFKKLFYHSLSLVCLVLINIITWAYNKGEYDLSFNISKIVFILVVLGYVLTPIVIVTYRLYKLSSLIIGLCIEAEDDPYKKAMVAQEARNNYKFIPFSHIEIWFITIILAPLIRSDLVLKLLRHAFFK